MRDWWTTSPRRASPTTGGSPHPGGIRRSMRRCTDYFAGDFAAISALRAAAARRLRSEPPRGPSLGPSDQFTLSRLRAQCGRRVSFPAMGKKPMAQATLSCPFGAIHLEDRRGTAQDGHSVSIFALPIPSGLRPSPLDKGSRPPVPRYGGRSSESLYIISGAQNLSGCLNSSRPTGAWVYKN